MKNETKQITKYYVGALALQMAAVAVCIGCHRLFIHIGGQIAAPELINGELTSPTVGRCIYVFLAGIAFLILTILASRSAGKGKTFRAFAFGFFAGIFLWQSIGEDAWHFSLGGMHFACLESISVLPFAILFVLMLCYCARRKALDWGVWCTALSFAVNWFGHFVLIGVYPMVASLIEKSLWCKCVGVILGGSLIIAGVICGVKKSKTGKERMLSAILTYHGLGILMSGIMA